MKSALSPRGIVASLKNSQESFDRLQKDAQGFKRLVEILKDASGIHLPENTKNLSLLAGRLGPILSSNGFQSYKEYEAYLRANPGVGIPEFVCALTTNTTQFFREMPHFEFLRQHLPVMIAAKQRKYQHEFRVWCSVASTGQEPYTIAMTLLESLRDPATWNIQFLATDIDEEVLEKACKGVYTEAEVEGVPPLFRQKYFNLHANGKSQQVKSELQKLIRFAPFNLITKDYPFKHRFDLIFCRNVLIYFDPPTAQAVVNHLIEQLTPGGLLFLGHSESGALKSSLVTSISHSVYQRNKSGAGSK
jgi:chemotaxis protein methyltransferase CheR